jgi:hypothetical protein
VEVGPVDGIRGKLALVGDYVEQHRAQLAGGTVTVVLPKTAVDGRPLAEVESRMVARVREAAGTAGLPVAFHFVETLEDLDPVLGPFVAQPIVDVRRAAIIGATVVAAGAGAAAWGWITSAPVSLSWMAVDGDATSEALPRRAVYRADTDRLELLPTCFDEQRQPVVVGGETLVLRVRAEDTRPLAGLLAPARYFIASVSREADPIVLDASLFRTSGSTVNPGSLEDAIAAVPVESADDEIRLFVVATRDPAASLSGLTEELRSRLSGLDGAAALATSAQFLSDRFDGQIDYQFRVTTDASACPPAAGD